MKEKRWVFLFDCLSILRFIKRNRNDQKLSLKRLDVLITDTHVLINHIGKVVGLLFLIVAIYLSSIWMYLEYFF